LCHKQNLALAEAVATEQLSGKSQQTGYHAP
jgi:hypothetical protein